MATINKKSKSKIRTTIETAFYANNIKEVTTLKEAYFLAKNSPGTIITNQSIYRANEMGLDDDSKVLLFNDGAVTGRYKDARVIIGNQGIDEEKYAAILRDEIYKSRKTQHLITSAYIGLDKEFMLKANFIITEGNENLLYNWLLNFQDINSEYKKLYEDSLILGEEDILVYSNPDWYSAEYPLGLAIFDPENNCVAILGMKYFGEHKKGSLTLAWNIGRKVGYVPCHGGIKEFYLNENKKYVMSFFGLSGSGKSTLTHCSHDGKYKTMILHDDAFIISVEKGMTIALEPSYFDKTQDYPEGCVDNKYLLTVQNCGARKNEKNEIVLVTEDIRNSNGRAIKSKFWKENRVDRIDDSLNSIVWIMKDPTLPPVIKITDSILASTFGATLATKRSSAEKLKDESNYNELVIEPYANPFRTYPLIEDYVKFKYLFESKKIDCYIVNTGDFMSKDIKKETTIGIIEKIVSGEFEFKRFGTLNGMEYLEIEGYKPDFNDINYVTKLKNSINMRINYLKSLHESDHGIDKLPDETIASLKELL